MFRGGHLGTRWYNGGGGTVTDAGERGVLRAGRGGERAAPARVRRAARGGSAARQGQVLELRFLQVHFRVRRGERAVHGRGAALVLLVHAAREPASARTALQGPLRIRECLLISFTISNPNFVYDLPLLKKDLWRKNNCKID